jgi:hypothetical protein
MDIFIEKLDNGFLVQYNSSDGGAKREFYDTEKKLLNGLRVHFGFRPQGRPKGSKNFKTLTGLPVEPLEEFLE